MVKSILYDPRDHPTLPVPRGSNPEQVTDEEDLAETEAADRAEIMSEMEGPSEDRLAQLRKYQDIMQTKFGDRGGPTEQEISRMLSEVSTLFSYDSFY